MIIQSPQQGQTDDRRFVIKLEEHLELVGQLAQSFGNAEFRFPSPREEFLYACRWHDRGWRDLDDNPPLDPRTGLPYNLIETPIPTIVLTGARSPEHNEAHHLYCGLINSMHIWGLYNGRYGMSDKVLIDTFTEADRTLVNCMLDGERQRQIRLKAALADNPETASWVEERRLFTHYKLLQFFDTFALYFNCTHASGRGGATFPNVPRDVDDDVEIWVHPEGRGTYKVEPYPFSEDPLEIWFQGRFLKPCVEGKRPDMAAVMRDTPVEPQAAILFA